MNNAVFALSLFAIAIIATLVLRALNIRKETRGRQVISLYASPIVAIGGIVAAIIFYESAIFNELFFSGNPLSPELRVVAWNIIIVLIFLLIKVICIPISSLWAKNSLMETTSSTWYRYDKELERWFLKDEYVAARKLSSALTWAIGVFVGAVFAYAVFSEGSEQSLVVYPSAILIVIAEIANFLSGCTAEEWLHSVSGEGIRAVHMRAYYKLRRVYEQLFPSAILASKTGNEYGGKVGATQLIEELRESNDDIERSVGNYFDGLPIKNGFFNVDMVSATVTLMKGRNVVFFNPHYRDLSDYILLPIIDRLISNKKCLVINGRNGSKEQIIHWLTEVLRGYGRTRKLWRVAELGKVRVDCEVGVLPFRELYNASTLKANSEFFRDVGVVLIIEPSKMLATSQVGLSMLADNLQTNENVLYAICDHEIDGLVDSLSHTLQIEITHACSAPIPHTIYSLIGWSATGDLIRQQLFNKQTRYLGNGVEIAAVALKNQIPHVTWLSEEKVPVRDIRWIAGQYYPQICHYANLPSQQSSLEKRLEFSSAIWDMPASDECFVIAEDELCNMYATMRAYLSRGIEQSFVNVISENYLMRDYMRYNGQIFLSDPKAIPAIAPHYAKTERNTILKLILMMAYQPVDGDYIAHELDMIGQRPRDILTQLEQLIKEYTGAEEDVVVVKSKQSLSDDLLTVLVNEYSIPSMVFDELFAGSLKNAFFVVEDEEFESEYIDSRLFGHITQIAMPGQLLTYEGKYYRVHKVTPEIGCILHRAADSFMGRRYYRQLRMYELGGAVETISSMEIMDLSISVERRDFSVSSSGYLEMTDSHDLRTARLINLANDPSVGIYRRSYRNKSVLRIDLPDTDDRIRFTICMLLSELAKTLFPYSWPYLAFLCVRPADIAGMLDKYNYSVCGDVEEAAIYIVEDSDMDLGLLEAVSNNIHRLFEMLADYLDWHFEKMKEPASKDPVLDPVVIPEDRKPKKKVNPLQRISQRLANIFARKHDDELDEPREEPLDAERDHSTDDELSDSSVEVEEGTAQTESSPFEVLDGLEGPEKPEEPTAESGLQGVEEYDFGEELQHDVEGSQEEGRSADEAVSSNPDMPYEQLAIPEEETLSVIDDKSATPGSDYDDIAPIELMEEYKVTPSRYQRECFLKFGFEDIDDRLQIEKVASYFAARGWTDNDLTKSRHRDELDAELLDLSAENTCDFCGLPLSGVSYDKLADGRTRCNDCSMTAIDDLEEYKKLFRYVEVMMESSFGITMPVSINVKTTDARTLAKASGSVFRPSSGVAPRTLGFASVRRGNYSLFVENGSPRLAAIDTTAHELTHIWQYINWKDDAVEQIYRMPGRECTARAKDIVYEGMACWASVQILYLMGETHYARQQELLYEQRNDVYGKGFVLYRERYGLEKNGEAPAVSPFGPFPTLEIEDVLNASKLLCIRKAEDCVC